MGAPTIAVGAPKRRLTGPLSRWARTWWAKAWWDRAEDVAGVVAVGACCLFVLLQLQPHLLLRNTTPAGGDTGAHVWWPAYLRDHLLPQWRIAGWAPDWYAGFPAGQFYFPLPALMIVALDVILPYNIAFKLVTALGPVALPAAAYAFGRGLRAPKPAPPLMALGAVGFLFFKGRQDLSQWIMGGNLPSTLAGEFSFTIALAFALFFLGALAWTLDHRRRAWLPALLLAAAVMSHLVVGVFAVVGALVIWLFRSPPRTAPLAAAVGGVGALLTMVWTLPLVTTLGYTTDMGYEPIDRYRTYLLSHDLRYLLPFVVIAVVGGVIFRRRVTLELVVITVAMGVLFRFWDALGTPAWNLRIIPFWYLGAFLLAALGGAEIVLGLGWLARRTVDARFWDDWDETENEDDEHEDEERSERPREGGAPSPIPAVTAAVAVLLVIAVGLFQAHTNRQFLDFWVRWNYTGFERTGAGEPTAKEYPEFRALLDAVAELPPGRALWENDSDAIGLYGTPLALMTLPYFTDGRIDSMEGVYFEASATTPYHFLAVATLTSAGNASNPVRGLPYLDINSFDLGVRYLQVLGVRYYIATSADATQRADAHPALELVAQSADFDNRAPFGWKVYEVADAPLVEPLTSEPVVVDGVDAGGWRDDVAVPWFGDAAALDRPLVADGPDDWAHADADVALDEPRTPLPEVTVSDVRETNDSISFRVSRTGVPVVVKASYFPNWRAEGADGPWRATPNFMVVVPTEREVRLEYGTTTAEWAGRAGTVAGVVGLGLLAWWWPGGGRRRRGGGRGVGRGGDEPAPAPEPPPGHAARSEPELTRAVP